MRSAAFNAWVAHPHPQDRWARESTVLYVFRLIWPRACIDCSVGDDCYLVGICEDSLRHIVRVPCALVEQDQGLTLVRAVYRSGIPNALGGAPSAKLLSL